MTNRDWAKLGVKLTGLWFMISAVVSAANVASIFGQPGVRGISISLLYPLAGGLTGLLIWIKSDRLASSIFPIIAPAENLLTPSLQQRSMFALAVSILGVLLVAEAIPTVVSSAALFVISRSSTYQSVFGLVGFPADQARLWSASAQANLVAAFVRALIGFGLLTGPTRLFDLVAALRGDLRELPRTNDSVKRT